MRDVIVVGGGIFGRVIGEALHRVGADVLVIDDARPMSGSAPAGCVMKPSWLASMASAQMDASFALLDELYGVEQLPFQIGPLRGLDMSVRRVRPSRIFGGRCPTASGTVDRLTQDDRSVTLRVLKEPGEHTYPTTRHVVLACGSWAQELAPWAPAVKRQGGWAFTWQASRPGPGSISVWAPYKQVVAFEREDGEVWAGDGSALKPESMAEARMQLSLDRCCEVAFPGRRGHGLRSLASVHAGYRPYAERSPGQPCVLETRGRVTVATGGAKNGTMAAGWCAHRLREELSWR